MKKWLVVSLSLASLHCAAPSSARAPATYDPAFDPSAFVAGITHPLFPLSPGRKWSYREGPTGTVDVEVLSEQKVILGVTCTTVHDVARDEGVIEEDTLDWYAQDRDGNVWYFGEDTKELDAKGNVKSTAGSWMAGVDGAKAGVLMPASPVVGDVWREEFLPGQAEDSAKAVSLNAGIRVPAGSYTGCLKTFNFTPVDATSNELKLYCPSVGPVWAVDLRTDELEELTQYTP